MKSERGTVNGEQIKRVIQRMCLDMWGKKAVIAADWDLDEIADAVAKYCESCRVEPALCLAQGILEGHFGVAPTAKRTRLTRNIFNVGNVDDGRNRTMVSWAEGIRVYCRLMAREYCYRNEGHTVSVEMMVKHDFVRPRGGRYATAPSYTKDVMGLAEKIRGLLVPADDADFSADSADEKGVK